MDRPPPFSDPDTKLSGASRPAGEPAPPFQETFIVVELHDLSTSKEGSGPDDVKPRAAPTSRDTEKWDGIFEVKDYSHESGNPRASPEHTYNPNYLHPPTSSRDSFIGPWENERQNLWDPGHGASRRLSVNMDKTSRFGWWTLVLLFLTVLMVTLTSVYANGSAKRLMQDKFFTTSSSNAIFILRILTEACALLFAALMVLVMEDLQWALASRPGGVSLLHFVGLDSGTGVWGLLRLLATADWSQKYSSLFRLFIICIIPLPGILLLRNLSLELVFFPQHKYKVAAGIDRFNASYISEVDDTIATALLIQMGSPSWSERDTWALDPLDSRYGLCTVSATDDSWTACEESHLLVGGVLGTTPQSDNLTSFRDATAYVIPDTRSVQLEYGPVHDIDGLYNNGTCRTIGAASAAAYWCAAMGPDQELLFGSSYCPIAVQARGQCLNDTSWTSPLHLASSLFVYKRHATVNYDRGNFSILSVTDLTRPEREIIQLEDYLLAISAVVPGFSPINDTTSSTNATQGDNSALAVYAVTALPVNDNAVAKKMSLAAIRKAMSVPFNYFHANYFSTQSLWELDEPRAGLSEDMYTTLSLAVLSHQVIAGKVSRYLFGLFSFILLALATSMIIITTTISERRPQRCGYPTLDFAAVCAAKTEPSDMSSSAHDVEMKRRRLSGLHRSLTQLGEKPGPFKVASKIKHERIALS